MCNKMSSFFHQTIPFQLVSSGLSLLRLLELYCLPQLMLRHSPSIEENLGSNWKESFEEQIEVIVISISERAKLILFWLNGRIFLQREERATRMINRSHTQDIYHKEIVDGRGVRFCDADGVIEY